MAADRIKQLREVIRETDESQLKEKVYVCVANGCILLTAYLNSNGQKGWSARLIDDSGQPILNGNEQKVLEDILEKAPWVLDFFKESKVQRGGAINDIDISLDKGLEYVIETSEKTDLLWKNIEKNSFGNIKTFMDTDQIVPTSIGPVPIKPRLVSKLLIAILDLLRLASSRAGYSAIPLTLIVFLEELVTGQWRQMILTAASLFITPSGVATSIMIKYVIIAWLTIDGKTRTRLVKDIFKGTKSFITNFLIWCYAILTPGPIKTTMFGIQMQLPQMPKMPQIPKIPQVPKLEVPKLEVPQLEVPKVEIPQVPQVPKVEIPQVPKVQVPVPRKQRGGGGEITYDVIQEKLKILDNPALLCSPAGKDLVKEITTDPILRLVAELLNIPSPETLDKVCTKALTMSSFADAEDDLEDTSPVENANENHTKDALDAAPAAEAPPAAAPAAAEAAPTPPAATPAAAPEAPTPAPPAVAAEAPAPPARAPPQAGGRKSKKMNKKPVKKSRKHGHRRP